MHSKELHTLRLEDGRIDISCFFPNVEETIRKDHLFFQTEDGIKLFWKRSEIGTLTDFGEVVASHLARQFGLRSSKYFFASLHGKTGVISLDFKKEGETEILGADFLSDCFRKMNKKEFCPMPNDLNNLTFIQKALAFCVENKIMSHADASNILRNIIKTAMMDFAFLNPDRHARNWSLLRNEKGSYRFAPVFDSSRCYSLYIMKSTFAEQLNKYYEQPTKANLAKMEKFFAQLNKQNTMSLRMGNQDYDAVKSPNIVFLTEFQKLYPNEFECLLQSFYSLNFEKAFESVKRETGVAVPPIVQAIMINGFEPRYFEAKKHFPPSTVKQNIASIAVEL